MAITEMYRFSRHRTRLYHGQYIPNTLSILPKYRVLLTQSSMPLFTFMTIVGSSISLVPLPWTEFTTTTENAW